MIECIQPATEYPLTLDEIKTHTRVTIDADDEMLMGFQAAAVEGAQTILRQQIMPARYQYRAAKTDGLPVPYYTGQCWRDCCPLILAPGPVQSIESVSLPGGVDTDEWELLQKSPFGLFQMTSQTAGGWWIETAPTITYTAGWPDAASVPGNIKAWLLMRITSLYENRNEWLEGRGAESPFFNDLLLPQRDFRF